MKMKSNFHIHILLIISWFLACKSVSYTVDSLPDKQIILGTEGGFSGKSTQYTLVESGQVFKSTGFDDKAQELKGLSKAKLKKLFKSFNFSSNMKYIHDVPGNYSNFMTIREGDMMHKIVWTKQDSTISKEIRDFYDTFNKHINK